MNSSDTPRPGHTQAASPAEGARQRLSLRPLLTLKPLILAHKGALAGAVVALVVSALAMLAVPMAVRRMIDKGFGGNNSALINNYFLTLIGIGIIIAIASPARYYFVNWIGERVVADLRTKVFAQLAKLGPAYFDRNHSGEMMSRLTADTTQIKAVAGSALSQAARNLIMLIGALIMMFVTSAKLSALIFIAIPIIVLPLVGFGRLVRRLSRRAQDTLGDASAYAAENLAAHRTMQAYVNEKAVSDRFGRAVERAFGAARERMKARAALTGVAIFLTVASVTGVLWYGASAVIAGEMTGGRLSQFVLYALFAAGALAELSEVWGEISQAAGSAERLSEMMATVPEIRSPEHPVPLPQPALGTIAFENVTFKYPARPDVAGSRRRVVPGQCGRDDSACRAVGRRQEYDLQFAFALLRPRRRHRARRWRQRRRCRSCGAAPAHRRRAAGRCAFRGHGCREHPLRHAGRYVIRGSPRRDGRAGR